MWSQTYTRGYAYKERRTANEIVADSVQTIYKIKLKFNGLFRQWKDDSEYHLITGTNSDAHDGLKTSENYRWTKTNNNIGFYRTLIFKSA